MNDKPKTAPQPRTAPKPGEYRNNPNRTAPTPNRGHGAPSIKPKGK